jgi:hypothetical protein
MNRSPKKFIKALFFIFFANIIWLTGCGGANNNSNQSQNPPAGNNNSVKSVPSDNMEELFNLVRVPEVPPEEVIWLEDTKANPKKLVAVLQFKPENLPGFVALVEKNKTPEPVEIDIEDWFPQELKAQAQLSGMEMLKGTSYGANNFYNIPYGSGRIVRIEGTDYFVLELTASN